MFMARNGEYGVFKVDDLRENPRGNFTHWAGLSLLKAYLVAPSAGYFKSIIAAV